MKPMKNRITILVIAAASLLASPVTIAHAAAPYETYSYDSMGNAIPSQAGYAPERAVSGYDLGVGAMDAPEDIFMADDGLFYIVDSGNNRIIAADSELTSAVRTYSGFSYEDGTVTPLNQPKGIYVCAEKDRMYVADTENSRVLVTTLGGEVVSELSYPDSPIYNSPTFRPQKVIADKAGNVYTIVNNTTGAAMFSPDGEFTGFYGANRVQPTAEVIGNYFRSFFMSDEKKLSRIRSIPTAITGFDISGDFVYTCTASNTQQTDTVKKLNAAGKNIFSKLDVIFGDRKPMYDTSHNQLLASAMTDIEISSDGCINCLDLTMGRIFRYDEDGELMFIIGGKAEQLGGFDTVSAIESYGERLYASDSVKDTITVFRETSFGRAVNKAVSLYGQGYYEEALEPWYEVLSRDGNYRRANTGVAMALLRKGDYEGAMEYAKKADSSEIYNKAFEGYRREFLGRNLGKIVLSAGAAAAGIFAAVKLKKRRSGGGRR